MGLSLTPGNPTSWPYELKQAVTSLFPHCQVGIMSSTYWAVVRVGIRSVERRAQYPTLSWPSLHGNTVTERSSFEKGHLSELLQLTHLVPDIVLL